MPALMDIVVGDLHFALRVWQAVDEYKTPAVLLHATGKTARDWDVIASGLCAERTVYAVDLRGHGASDWPGTYSLQLFAQDVIGILDQLDIGTVDLGGHSLGGLVACRVAAEPQGHVRKLVLEDIGFPHPRPPGLPDRPAGDLPFDWHMVEQVRPEIDDPDPGWADIVDRITAPTLLIGGGAASPVPQEHVAELADRLADAQLTTIAAGHLVHETVPDEYLRTLIAFLSE
ncbi:alpha/beta hydrolase [Verrucosispora sp. WMMA2044]|uniref:Alpha/beta fold hydrolase n=1 Tax=Verrucosispora sioxanthis TaxID=2499994 RepID=A0A6M1LCC1_9ACTN|nr:MULTISPECIES: alpha/beta hydrolase [Micromonospora]NEE66757.1 alpha/beta fold hydrolase [Verrucosispora sioxanthis]NGM15867.1 alpha/beta fold hydrolase [Verrucosispora sioxanthis]WBB50242.1 alpha/beta hydrolase [Verrucosispora sp. WMMA2044]